MVGVDHYPMYAARRPSMLRAHADTSAADEIYEKILSPFLSLSRKGSPESGGLAFFDNNSPAPLFIKRDSSPLPLMSPEPLGKQDPVQQLIGEVHSELDNYMFDQLFAESDATERGADYVPPVAPDTAETVLADDGHGAKDVDAEMGTGDADDHIQSRHEAARPVYSLQEYCSGYMGIHSKDLKPTALARMQDLAQLFRVMACSGIIRLSAAPAGRVDSIFGFERLIVDEVAAFHENFASMVCADRNRCWHANGRRTFAHSTGPCYEILRQLGIHPVRGTRGRPGQNAPAGTRNFMFYSEFTFSFERMRRNCHRLKVGVIGNRRS